MIVDSFPHCVWEDIIPLSVERTQPKECRDWPFRLYVRDWDGQTSEPYSLTSLRASVSDSIRFCKAHASGAFTTHLQIWSFGSQILSLLVNIRFSKKLDRLVLLMRGDSLC